MSYKLTIQLVTWNGEKYIPYLFQSLRSQTFQNWFLLVLDNNSSDTTVSRIRHELDGLSGRSSLIERQDNIGFAGGHNFLLKNSDSEYVLFINQDMYLVPDALQKMIELMDAEKKITALAPRLMRWNFDTLQSSGLELSFTNQLDTLGLKVHRNRRVTEFHTGETWPVAELSKQRFVEVFGVSGAFPLYRRTDLLKTAFDDGTIYDETYNSYKEDVDLAYRLRSMGMASVALLDAVVYHDRTAAGPKGLTDFKAAANKKLQSPRVKYLSYKNHLATIYKNEYWQNFTLDFFWIFCYEFKKFVYYLFVDFSVLTGLSEIRKNRANLRRYRLEIKAKRKINWKALRKWWE